MIIVGNRTSTTVKSLETANGTYTYTYDAAGNILSINDGTYTVSYVYDGLNQLVRENDQRADTTTVFTYTVTLPAKRYINTLSAMSEKK